MAPVSGAANVRSSVSAPLSNVGFNLGGWVTSVCAEEKVLVWVNLATILSFPAGRDQIEHCQYATTILGIFAGTSVS